VLWATNHQVIFVLNRKMKKQEIQEPVGAYRLDREKAA